MIKFLISHGPVRCFFPELAASQVAVNVPKTNKRSTNSAAPTPSSVAAISDSSGLAPPPPAGNDVSFDKVSDTYIHQIQCQIHMNFGLRQNIPFINFGFINFGV
jgi:hypothetical protein